MFVLVYFIPWFLWFLIYLIFSSMTLITNIDYIYLPKFCQNFSSANTYWVLNVTISYGSVYCMVQFHISTSNGRSESLSFSVVFSFYLLKSCLQNIWRLYEVREIRAIFFTRDCFYVLCALELCFLSHTMVCWCRWISQNEKWMQTCGFKLNLVIIIKIYIVYLCPSLN